MSAARPSNDPLSHLLSALRLSDAPLRIGRPEELAPTRDHSRSTATLYLMLSGRATLAEVRGDQAVDLEAGAAAIVVGSARWRVGAEHPGWCGRGDVKGLACTFELRDAATEGLLGFLPSLVLVDATSPEMKLLLSSAREAVQTPRPGNATILARLCELVLLLQLRAELAEMPATTTAAHAGLRDSRIVEAMALMHRAPDRAWTVEELARAVGISRSRFSERFRRSVGDTPMRYLTRRRVERARSLLTDDRRSLVEVAEQCGYSSEDAFSRAFRRIDGRTPAAWRRAWLSAAPEAA